MHQVGKRAKRKKQEVGVLLRRDPDLGFCWTLLSNGGHGGAFFAGFDSLQEMFSDIEFLRMLQKNLGADSVPEYVVEHALEREKVNTVPIDDDMVAALKEMFGSRVVDNRKSKK